MATLPESRESKVFANGSVVKRRKPLEVPMFGQIEQRVAGHTEQRRTYSQMTVVLVESHKVHSHGAAGLAIGDAPLKVSLAVHHEF